SSSGRGNEPFNDVFVIDVDGRNERNLTNARGWDLLQSWSPDGSRVLYSSNGLGPEDYWVADPDGGEPVRIAQNNTCWSPPDWSPDGKRLVGCQCGQSDQDNACSLFTVDADGTNLETFAGVSGAIRDPKWSPDGSRLLYVEGRNTDTGSVFVVDVTGGQPRKVYEGKIGRQGEDVAPPAWSPDGRNIAIATDSQLVVVPADGGEQRVAIDEPIVDFAWSPDGSQIAYLVAGGLMVTDMNGVSAVEVSSGPIGWGFSWSPDGTRIVFSGAWERQDGTYWISPDGSKRGLIAPYVYGAGTTPAPGLSLEGGCRTRAEGSRWECLSPDGNSVATTDAVMKNGVGYPGLAVEDLGSGTRTDISLPGINVLIGRPAWSPDGQQIAFRGHDADGCWLYTMTPDGNDLRRVVSMQAPTTCGCIDEDVWAMWSSDGQYIYYVKGAVAGEGCAPGFLYRVRADGTGEQELADLRVGSLFGFAP
ncbi:MAG: hypothetical protein ABSG55_04365, partial [Dehalococcoidia bacterium]